MSASDDPNDPKAPKRGEGAAASGAKPGKSRGKSNKAGAGASGKASGKARRRSRPIAVPEVPSEPTEASAVPTVADVDLSASTGVPAAASGPTATSGARFEVAFSELEDEPSDGHAVVPPPADVAAAAAPAGPTPGAEASIPAGASGSVEVAVDVSGASLTAIPATSSGSVDISLTNLASAAPEPATASTQLPVISDGTPAVVGEVDSAPVSSGKVKAAVAGESTGRSKRITTAAKDTLGASVSALGTGLGTIGEGVSKLGEASRKVPLVGSSVSKLGEGLSQVGESLHELPRVAGTRRGRLLVRSLFVGLVLVAAWISIIVALQLKGNETPDFRPIAERILVQLSAGHAAIEEIYDRASPRFHEMARKEKFVDDMNDLTATVGRFVEITAVNETLVTTGPGGRIGRVSLTVAYERATCKASVSLHADQGKWKLLGIGVELPPELEITQAQREERVQACKSPMDKSCDLYVAANKILEQLRDGEAAAVWDGASQVFQKQEERGRWSALQAEHAKILGGYVRILAVTEAKMIGGTTATYDVILEYARANGVRAIFGFYRRSKQTPWKLVSLKIVLPMPRAGESSPAAAAVPPSAESITPSVP